MTAEQSRRHPDALTFRCLPLPSAALVVVFRLLCLYITPCLFEVAAVAPKRKLDAIEEAIRSTHRSPFCISLSSLVKSD